MNIIKVNAVHKDAFHRFHKIPQTEIQLLSGIGVSGDAHAGEMVQHEYLQRKDPDRPNLRQVHLIQAELFADLRKAGFRVEAGQLGENITTMGIDLLSLPLGTEMDLGESARIQITGLRTPCKQIDDFQPGLMNALIEKNADGTLIRKAGVMAVVLQDGVVKPGDRIKIKYPPEPHQPLPAV